MLKYLVLNGLRTCTFICSGYGKIMGYVVRRVEALGCDVFELA
jgi:hypothetical protein